MSQVLVEPAKKNIHSTQINVLNKMHARKNQPFKSHHPKYTQGPVRPNIFGIMYEVVMPGFKCIAGRHPSSKTSPRTRSRCIFSMSALSTDREPGTKFNLTASSYEYTCPSSRRIAQTNVRNACRTAGTTPRSWVGNM